MKQPRGNANQRGSTIDRRRRKRWLLSPEAGHGGNHTHVPCAFGCGAILTFATLWVDRFPILGHQGGSYRHENIRPACGTCQTRQGAAIANAKKRKRVSA